MRMRVECPSCSARPRLSCVSAAGDSRYPHVSRLLVAAAVAAVAVLWRWLPVRERDRLVLEMVSEPDFSDVEQSETTDPDAEAHTGGQPDWEHLWGQLLAASVMTGKVRNVLAGPRMHFDFGHLAKKAELLHDRVVEAYELMCEAPRYDGLDLDQGDTLDVIRRRLDIRRGELDDRLPRP